MGENPALPRSLASQATTLPQQQSPRDPLSVSGDTVSRHGLDPAFTSHVAAGQAPRQTCQDGAVPRHLGALLAFTEVCSAAGAGGATRTENRKTILNTQRKEKLLVTHKL